MFKFEINQQAGKPLAEKLVKSWLNKVAKILHLTTNLEISLGIVGDSAMRQLNKVYRGKNKVTDVLSFTEDRLATSQAGKNYLGEIIICYPQARRRAKQAGHSLSHELELLLVHGCMHLLGYDHQTEKQAQVMEKIEKKIRQSRG